MKKGEWKGRWRRKGKIPSWQIFAGFFLGIDPLVEKSWQETGRLYSRENHWGGFFQEFLPLLVMGKKFGILEVGKALGMGLRIPSLIRVPGVTSTGISIPIPMGMGIPALTQQQHPKYSMEGLGSAKSCVPMFPKRLRIPNNSGSMWDPHPQPLWDSKILNSCPIISQKNQDLSGIF